MTSPSPLWEQAASCYEAAGAPVEAARCHHRARAYRRAAAVYLQLGMHVAAAAEYIEAGMGLDAAWLLAHHAGDPAAARAARAGAEHGAQFIRDLIRSTWPDDPLESELSPVPVLLHRLVLARCVLAESGAAGAAVLPLLAEVQEVLADQEQTAAGDRRLEDWAVAVAEVMRRYDQVALIFAAAVRGRRGDAAERWHAWAAAHLNTPIVLPRPEHVPA